MLLLFHSAMSNILWEIILTEYFSMETIKFEKIDPDVSLSAFKPLTTSAYMLS